MATPTESDTVALVQQLAAEGLSHRTIGDRTNLHHTTVGRILRRTTQTPDAPPAPVEQPGTAPTAPAERTAPAPAVAPRTAPGSTTPAPPAATSGDTTAPVDESFELHPRLIQDLIVLVDCETGDLPAPLARQLHHAADMVRARWCTARTTPHHDRTTDKDTA